MDRLATASTAMIHRTALILATLSALLAGGVGVARAQEVRSTLAPDTILPGDVFRAAIRVELPPGYSLAAPDTIPIADEVENAGRRRIETRELPDGGTEVEITYPLTAWSPGDHHLPAVDLTLSGPDGIWIETVTLPVVSVASVLPGDTSELAPRPPKDVIGASRLIWPWILAALTIALGVVGFVYLQRRRRPPSPALALDVADPGSPRERALAALDRIRAAQLLERGEFKQFYAETASVLRIFLEEYDPDWGTDLTSGELIAATAAAIDDDSAVVLAKFLDAADQVKFNRRDATAEAAVADWEMVRHWIKAFRVKPSLEEVEELAGEENGASVSNGEVDDDDREGGEVAP